MTMIMPPHPFQLFNTSTSEGLKSYILGFYKRAEDVRILTKGRGGVDVLVLVKSKWWWKFTFGYMFRKVTTELNLIMEMKTPVGISFTLRPFIDRTKFLREAVGE